MKLVDGVTAIDDLDAFLGELTRIGEETGCTVQAFDARYVVDRAHLERALELADRAIERGENVARDRGVEVMLYAAGRRQIDRALTLGVSEGEGPVVVLVAAEGEDGDDGADEARGNEAAAAAAVGDFLAPADSLGDYDEDLVREYFGIDETELGATAGSLADVVHERVALLDVRK
ncbi:KEOPS complex subunit Cgi121 [Halobaculum magnesiiphilum]|uniref:KEOPS complex subunit Cgi121 n=1 Tax=Halobaculum magnesiiphilum TaxID=1017351 RepID=A0A8T8W9E6_9EURY|nr:KEOPS complex subunit Cgi121 [Halobaculum magnesiiphilum]QZP36451.1 KEOPS complex subunit Cgi121 [Halobaculum magnesiiphilum]